MQTLNELAQNGGRKGWTETEGAGERPRGSSLSALSRRVRRENPLAHRFAEITITTRSQEGASDPIVWLDRGKSFDPMFVDLRRPAWDHELETTFAQLAATWERETFVESFVHRKALHWAYQRIIGLGREAVPLILRRLVERPNHWFWALAAITGEDPASDTDSIEDATETWIRWGRDHRLV